MYGFHRFAGGGVLWPGLISMLLFWGLLIFVFVMLMGGGRRHRWHEWHEHDQHHHHGHGPEDILHERFARGEINQEEYHSRLTALRNGPPPPSPPESS